MKLLSLIENGTATGVTKGVLKKLVHLTSEWKHLAAFLLVSWCFILIVACFWISIFNSILIFGQFCSNVWYFSLDYSIMFDLTNSWPKPIDSQRVNTTISYNNIAYLYALINRRHSFRWYECPVCLKPLLDVRHGITSRTRDWMPNNTNRRPVVNKNNSLKYLVNLSNIFNFDINLSMKHRYCTSSRVGQHYNCRCRGIEARR